MSAEDLEVAHSADTISSFPSPGDTLSMVFIGLPINFKPPCRLVITPPSVKGYYIDAIVETWTEDTDNDQGTASCFVVDTGDATVEDFPTSIQGWRALRYPTHLLASRVAISHDTVDLAAGTLSFTDIQDDKVFQKNAKVIVFPQDAPQIHALALVKSYSAPNFTIKITSAADVFGVDTISVQTIAINNAGTGHARGDVITLAGGTASAQATVTVTDINDDTGAITDIELASAGSYSVFPSSPASQGSTTGSGTSATFDVVSSITYDDWLFELIDIPQFIDPSLRPFKHAFLGGY